MCALRESSGKHGFCEANPVFPSPLQWATSYGRPSALPRSSLGSCVRFACCVPRRSGQSKDRGHDRFAQGRPLGHDDSARRRGRHARRATLFNVESGSMEPKLSRAGSGTVTFGRSPLGAARATPTRRRVGPARKSFASRFVAISRGPLHLCRFLVYRAPRGPRSRILVHLQTPRNGTSLEIACWRSHRRVRSMRIWRLLEKSYHDCIQPVQAKEDERAAVPAPPWLAHHSAGGRRNRKISHLVRNGIPPGPVRRTCFVAPGCPSD